MAKEFYTVKVISHLENETGEYDYVPTYEVRIDKLDAHRTLRQIDDAGPVVFEVTVAYLPSQSI